MSVATTKAITPKAILSYPHLHQPQVGLNGGKPKYSCTLVFPAGTDLTQLEIAAKNAAEAKFGTKAAAMQKSSTFRSPFRRDGDEKGYPEGSVFVNVRSERKPEIVYSYAGPDGKAAVMADEKVKEEMYPGTFVRGSLSAFAYDTNGNRGVSFSLNNLQKIGEGTRLDGRKAAQDEFDVDLSAEPADISGLVS
jgi:hypothetical protein